MARPIPLLFALFALGVATPLARAHAVGMACRVEGTRIVVEAFYDDDSPAVRAKVRVLDGSQEVGTGLTDEKGVWSFARPAPGHYSVQLDAGAGHRATQTIEVPPSAESPATPLAIGAGASRQEFTRFPWDRLLLGLLAIFALAGAFLLVAALRKGIANGGHCTPRGEK
jgi:hypothetical protein